MNPAVIKPVIPRNNVTKLVIIKVDWMNWNIRWGSSKNDLLLSRDFFFGLRIVIVTGIVAYTFSISDLGWALVPSVMEYIFSLSPPEVEWWLRMLLMYRSFTWPLAPLDLGEGAWRWCWWGVWCVFKEDAWGGKMPCDWRSNMRLGLMYWP